MFVVYLITNGLPPGFGAGKFLGRIGAPNDEENRKVIGLLAAVHEHKIPPRSLNAERIAQDLMRWDSVRAAAAFKQAEALGLLQKRGPASSVN